MLVCFKAFWFGLLKLIITLSTAVKTTKQSALTNDANFDKAKSLSITPSTGVIKPFLSLIVGIPPPPPTTTIAPFSTAALIWLIPTKSNGKGDATTFLYPLPASSTITELGFICSASSLVE
ncbi:Uncharacterised protein [Chlamydia abortus]|nr:Uncharacterised protein [Chlamydia abortus]SGA31420.1 Uncharacterised protein [Chlamydia abortus]